MNLPPQVCVQLDKGKGKEVYLKITNIKNSFMLEVHDSPKTKMPKNSYGIRRLISEIRKTAQGDILTIITTSQEISFQFKNSAEAEAYHNFICEKSEVHAENKAIAQLDDEMRLIWPFPGGSFF